LEKSCCCSARAYHRVLKLARSITDPASATDTGPGAPGRGDPVPAAAGGV